MTAAGCFWTSAKTADVNGAICRPAATWPKCAASAGANLLEQFRSPAFRPQASDADPFRDVKLFRLKAGLQTALFIFFREPLRSQFWDRRFPQTNTFLGRRFMTISINAWLSVCCGR